MTSLPSCVSQLRKNPSEVLTLFFAIVFLRRAEATAAVTPPCRIAAVIAGAVVIAKRRSSSKFVIWLRRCARCAASPGITGWPGTRPGCMPLLHALPMPPDPGPGFDGAAVVAGAGTEVDACFAFELPLLVVAVFSRFLWARRIPSWIVCNKLPVPRSCLRWVLMSSQRRSNSSRAALAAGVRPSDTRLAAATASSFSEGESRLERRRGRRSSERDRCLDRLRARRCWAGDRCRSPRGGDGERCFASGSSNSLLPKWAEPRPRTCLGGLSKAMPIRFPRVNN